MTAKITLAADVESIAVGEIPYLFARARHPDLDKAAAPRAVILGKSEPDAQDISDLDDDDKALLSRIWSDIGGYPDSTPVDTFIRDHLTAFESHPERPSWDLRWNWADENHVARIGRAITVDAYQADIDASIKNDTLDVRNQSTLGPVRLPGFEEAVRRGCVVTIDELRRFAERYVIEVVHGDATRLPEEASAAPEPVVSCSGCDQGEPKALPRVEWRKSIVSNWEGIVNKCGRKASTIEVIAYLKKFDTSGCILPGGDERELHWKPLGRKKSKTVTDKTVSNALRDLEKAGLISR